MPNWTYNTITINGNKQDIEKMLNDAVKNDEGKLTFASWFPVPETYNKYDTTNHPNGERLKVGEKLWTGLEELNGVIITEELIDEYKRATKEQKELYGAVGWYDYNCKYYGCKWNCEVEIEEHSEESITLRTDTPWSDPVAFLSRLSERYPKLAIHNHADFEEGYWWDKSYFEGEEFIDGNGEDRWDDEDEDIIIK